MSLYHVSLHGLSALRLHPIKRNSDVTIRDVVTASGTSQSLWLAWTDWKAVSQSCYFYIFTQQCGIPVQIELPINLDETGRAMKNTGQDTEWTADENGQRSNDTCHYFSVLAVNFEICPDSRQLESAQRKYENPQCTKMYCVRVI